MVIVKKILAMRDIPPVSTLYSDHVAIDLSENFHLHWRNTQFVMDNEEFRAFFALVEAAHHRWRRIGSPSIHENFEKGEQYILTTSKIKDHPGSKNPYIANEGIRVELMQWADLIHIHWKWTRLEFDYQEFLDFADTMTEGAEELRSAPWFAKAPRRIGANHETCPHGRVDKPDNSKFWTQADQDDWLDGRHGSIFLDPQDAKRVKLPNTGVEPDKLGVPERRIYVNDPGILPRIGRLIRFAKRLMARLVP